MFVLGTALMMTRHNHPLQKEVENKATGNGVETLGASGW